MVTKLSGICVALLLPFVSFGCNELADTGSKSIAANYRSPTTDNPPTLLRPSSKTIDLGIVRQAGSEQETFSLTNPGTTPIEVSQVQTSCDCLEVGIPSRRTGIAPGETVLVPITLDLKKEPQFLGNLGIEVKGLTGAGQTAFSIVVQVSVRSPDEFETKEDLAWEIETRSDATQ